MNDLVQSEWSMEKVQYTLDKRSLSRTYILKIAYYDMCVCHGEWLQCAKQTLCNNGLTKAYLLMPLLQYLPWVA